MNIPPMSRQLLAGLLRAQKEIFIHELYPELFTDEEDENVRIRVYEAVKNTFEICAKIVEGVQAVGPLDDTRLLQ
jgi:hypothetical protein